MRLKSLKVLLLSFTTALAGQAFAHGLGLSTFPLETEQKLISAEATGIVSSGGGAGIQARYTQKINVGTTADVGFGVAGGKRSTQFFAGLDYEIFPDYENQPRFSLKANIANSKEFKQTHNIFTFAPTASKGFSFWGKEGYPYVAIPYGVSLNADTKSYQSTMSLALGANAHLPLEGYEKLVGNVELNANLKDSYSGIFLGLSYPLN